MGLQGRKERGLVHVCFPENASGRTKIMSCCSKTTHKYPGGLESLAVSSLNPLRRQQLVNIYFTLFKQTLNIVCRRGTGIIKSHFIVSNTWTYDGFKNTKY